MIPTYKSIMSDKDVQERLVATIDPCLERLHGLVVGPGLGRREGVLEGVARVIETAARERKMPVVLDADGLLLVVQRPELVAGCSKVVLTPNAVEFARLKRRLLPASADKTQGVPDAVRDAKELVDVCRALGGVTIVRKGPIDLISDGESILAVDEVCATIIKSTRCRRSAPHAVVEASAISSLVLLGS